MLRVRFARWFAMTMTGVGAVATVLGIGSAVAGSAAAVPLLIGGSIIAIFGLLYFGPIPYVTVSPTRVELSMTRGPNKRVAIGARQRLDTDGDRLLLVGDGGDVRRLPVYRSMAHPGDWADLVGTLRRR